VLPTNGTSDIWNYATVFPERLVQSDEAFVGVLACGLRRWLLGSLAGKKESNWVPSTSVRCSKGGACKIRRRSNAEEGGTPGPRGTARSLRDAFGLVKKLVGPNWQNQLSGLPGSGKEKIPSQGAYDLLLERLTSRSNSILSGCLTRSTLPWIFCVGDAEQSCAKDSERRITGHLEF